MVILMQIILKLTHGSYTMGLSLLPVDKLKPHEEILPSLARKLSDNMLKSSVFTHPIIVDENSLVILDGMHRYNAIKSLGAKLIPAVLVNYNDRNIKLLRWWRVVPSDIYPKIKDILGPSQPSISKNTFYVELRHAAKTTYYSSENLTEIFTILKSLERLVGKLGYEIRYVHEMHLSSFLKANIGFALFPPTKELVIDLASRGVLFPHKSTCHVFPARIYDINLPLDILFLEDYEEAISLTKKLIENKNIEKRGSKLPNAEFCYTLREKL